MISAGAGTLYRFRLDGVAQSISTYIGESDNLQRRSSGYRNPGPSQKTNIRAAMQDDAIRLVPPRPMSLEQALEFIAGDELVELTPGSIRLRKRFLDPTVRRREGRKK